MGARGRIIVGLDIGTTKICCLITERKETGGIEVIGFGQSESRGLRRGLVVNMEQTVEAIRRAVDDAERMAGVRVDEVYTGIAGGHIQGISTNGVIAIKGGEVAPADKKRVVDQAKDFAKPVGVEIIHVLPQEFAVDDITGIVDPVGMAGSRLEAKVHIVTGSVAAVSNITKCAQKAGLGLHDIVLQQIASAVAILTPDERQLGVILMDIGGGTTDIAVFNEGSIRHTSVLPLGGDHVTNDIAVGLRTPIAEAERLKIKYGYALSSKVSPDEQIEVPSIGGDNASTVPRRILSEIIESRMEELFKLAYSEVRIGVPRGVKGLMELVNNPAYATVVGLCLYDADKPGISYRYTGTNTFEKLLERMLRWFKEVF